MARRNVKIGQGLVSYQDDLGNTIIKIGDLGKGRTGFRLQDDNGIGVAEFIRNPDRSITLKIASSSVEVETATNDQLIFNSSQDIFKIVKSGTYTLTVSNPIAKDEIDSGSVFHGLGFQPAFIAYCTIPANATAGHLAGNLNSLPIVFASASFIEAIIYATVDVNNITFNAVNVWNGALTWGFTSLTFRFYLFQETSATS